MSVDQNALQNYAENVWPIRLNIYYLLLEKMNSFAEECKYDISNVPGAQIAQDYENNRTDAWNVIESLGIIKRIVSVCKHPVLDIPRRGMLTWQSCHSASCPANSRE